MTTDDPDLKYDRSLLGVDHDIGTYEVTRDMIIHFAHSTGETAPQYVDEEAAKDTQYGGLIAPPTFCNMFVNGVSRPDIKLEFGNVGLFAGQSIENVTPARPGDTLAAKTRLKEVYAKTGRSGKMVFAVWETQFTNQGGDTVALVQESFLRRNRSPK
ncbi:MAG: MaoC family dehydratase N-terminal domain-containing protein [SAR202 cluster bacterium]|jgi:acyl dehydratase|nr:MaoC family dehydratase N-terminal domain-containing protein [SAR202 cluster bacterium]MDP6514218.1 MaoC family dehydratase N-terminal domain-containing protein [SAR202 cluster bacterium]MDP6715645.1 MaoC family dehydratase N-terminal domain-containing protein [SAR202 cluster bacterium]|tara:strand:- start:525 stop:995 length:471 start_codon:yes stop_codon:yes gene_type:complete